MDKHIEIELKLLIKGTDLKKLLASALMKACLRDGSEKTSELETIYYDTPDFALKKHGIAYRVRNKGNNTYEATVKTAQKSSSGLSERLELNMPLPDEKAVLTGFKELGLGFELTELVPDGVEALFTTKLSRQTYVLDYCGSVIEMAVDKGEVFRADNKEKINEIEFELLNGDKGALIALAAEIAELVPVFIEKRSKFARGLALLGIEADAGRTKFKMADDGNLKNEMLAAVQVHCDRVLLLQNTAKKEKIDKLTVKSFLKELLYLRSYLALGDVFSGKNEKAESELNQWVLSLRKLLQLMELKDLWSRIYEKSSLVFDNSILDKKLAEAETADIAALKEQLKEGKLSALIFGLLNSFCHEQWSNEEYLEVRSAVRCLLHDWEETECGDEEKMLMLENAQYILKSIQGKNYAKAADKFKEKQKKLAYVKQQELYNLVRSLSVGSNSRVLSRDCGILLGWLLAQEGK